MGRLVIPTRRNHLKGLAPASQSQSAHAKHNTATECCSEHAGAHVFLTMKASSGGQWGEKQKFITMVQQIIVLVTSPGLVNKISPGILSFHWPYAKTSIGLR